VLVENVDIGICLIDSTFRLVTANSAQARLVGATPGALVGECCYQRFEGRATPCSHCPGIEAMATGQSATREIQATPPGRATRWVRVQAFPVRNEFGKSRGFIEVVEDVSAQHAAEAEKRAFEQRLRDTQKLESLGLLAGGVAHDFNNLLLGLLGNVDLARARLAHDSPARPHVDAIEGAAQRAADLTAQMLAYSGKGRFHVSQLDLSKLVEEMGSLLSTVISKSAEVRFRLGDDLPLVDGDGTQLRQVVMNLITNASDALTGRSGTITITTGLRELDGADFACMQLGEGLAPGRYVFVEVVDTGIGMDAETRRRMFDPFFTTKQTGRGLGLAAALGIVRGHRGAVLVESAPGVGTSFSVFLPAGQGRAEPREIAAEKAVVVQAPLPASKQRRVLVVDDEESVREVAAMILADAGYEVLTAADGREGIEVFQRERPIAVVLLDVTMPHLDGEQTLIGMRHIDAGVRIVLTSGYSNAESARRLVREGLASFLAKPYRSNELLDAIARECDDAAKPAAAGTG
jgi:PAS domain S-box-containing protein